MPGLEIPSIFVKSPARNTAPSGVAHDAETTPSAIGTSGRTGKSRPAPSDAGAAKPASNAARAKEETHWEFGDMKRLVVRGG